MKKQFEYTIGDKKYIQKALVIAQMRQLLGLFDTEKEFSISVEGIIGALQDRLHLALGILLQEDNVNLRDKDYTKLAEEIEYYIDIDLSMRIIEDFLDCNQITSISDRFKAILDKILKK